MTGECRLVYLTWDRAQFVYIEAVMSAEGFQAQGDEEDIWT
jgi:hypothetical protein